MTVFTISTSPFFQYDFRVAGVRYSGSTKTADKTVAAQFEESLRAEVLAGTPDSLRRRSRKRERYVYFLQGEMTKRIKIGSSLDVDERVFTLQIGSPDTLNVLYCGVGGSALEAECHRRFARFRLHGEWFEPAPIVLAFIEGAAQHGIWHMLVAHQGFQLAHVEAA